MPGLVELTDVMVAGATDLENCVGITGETYEDACRETMKQFPNLKKITTTTRDSIDSLHNVIAAMLFDGKKLLRSKTYDLTHIVDRVGAGDAFMSGLVYGMLSKKDDQQALEFATASCAWKHTVEGDANLATADEIENLVKGENVGKLLR
jgi:2-dehydro-3-deoxygluconokinase